MQLATRTRHADRRSHWAQRLAPPRRRREHRRGAAHATVAQRQQAQPSKGRLMGSCFWATLAVNRHQGVEVQSQPPERPEGHSRLQRRCWLFRSAVKMAQCSRVKLRLLRHARCDDRLHRRLRGEAQWPRRARAHEAWSTLYRLRSRSVAHGNLGGKDILSWNDKGRDTQDNALALWLVP